MSIADTILFCSMLQEVEYVQRLCEVGKAFQMAISGSAKFKERSFEVRHTGVYLNLSWMISLEFHLEDLR